MTHMVSCQFILVVLVASLSFGQTKVLTVCEVLTEIDNYRGQMIAVRGVVAEGHHGSLLGDYEQAGEPCPSFLKSGRQWPSSLALTWPDRPLPEDGPRRFVPDTEQIKQTLAEVRKTVSESKARGDTRLSFIATIIGELRSRREITIFRDREGWYAGNGYGQGGQFPADLVIKSVADPKLVDLSNWTPKTQPPR